MNKENILISVKNLQKYFVVKKRGIFNRQAQYVRANKNITIDVYKGETLGIVGESGCGKSTFGRTIIQLQKPTGGSSLYYQREIDELYPKYVKKVYQRLVKNSAVYDKENEELIQLKAKVKQATGANRDILYDQYRLKKIEFANKHNNSVRLVGGLLAYHNLAYVSSLLIKKYTIGKKLLRLTEKENKNDVKIKQYSEQLNEVLSEINQLKEQLKDDPKFIKYEERLDFGIDLALLTSSESRKMKKELQMVFQDPYSSLDSRLTVGDLIGEGLLIHKMYQSKKDPKYLEHILDIMDKCGLDAKYINRYPHQFSGGQRQRIVIARALALHPKFVVCDEAVSALDVSIQSQIINLLNKLKSDYNLTYLFITHDLGVVRYISDRIGVMYFGNLVELAKAEDIFTNPQHPYTKELLNAIIPLKDDKSPHKIWDINYDTDQFYFDYHLTGEAEGDWFEVSEGHFVACHLKNDQID